MLLASGLPPALGPIVAINGWNRFNVAFHTPAGNYKSSVKQSAA